MLQACRSHLRFTGSHIMQIDLITNPGHLAQLHAPQVDYLNELIREAATSNP